MMEMFTDEMRRNPYPLYDELRNNMPVFQVPGTQMWMLFDYESVKRALTDHEAFSSVVRTPAGGKTPDWLVFSDPPRHTKLRGLIMRAFTPRSIASLEPRVRELSRELLAPHLGSGELDLVADYSAPLPVIVMAELLGIPAEDRPRFLRWGEVIMNLSYNIEPGEAADRSVREHAAAKEEMRAYLAHVREERRQAPRDDLLTRLFEAEVDGERLTEEEVLGFFQLLLSAGTETTTNLIDNAMLCFLEHPDQLARLRGAPELLPSAIEEVLRYRSPAQVMYRETKRELVLHGVTLPAGTFVLPIIGSANRDPRQFHEPHRFDIGRNPNPHIAFGHGIHFCLGAALSRLEARVALGDLLERMQDFALASAEPWEPRKALHVHGPLRLPLRFAPSPRHR